MITLTRTEYLERAAEALYARIPAAWMLRLREEMDGVRSELLAGIKSRRAQIDELLETLMAMDVPFARVHFERLARDPDTRNLCRLVVARYVFARETVLRRVWRCPVLGGVGDREFNEACLLHLLGPQVRHHAAHARSRCLSSDTAAFRAVLRGVS